MGYISGMVQFGKNIRQTRVRAGLTQVQIARKLGVSQNQISRYERDENIPSADTLWNLADILKVSINDLCLSDDESKLAQLKVKTKRSKASEVKAMYEGRRETGRWEVELDNVPPQNGELCMAFLKSGKTIIGIFERMEDGVILLRPTNREATGFQVRENEAKFYRVLGTPAVSGE